MNFTSLPKSIVHFILILSLIGISFSIRHKFERDKGAFLLAKENTIDSLTRIIDADTIKLIHLKSIDKVLQDTIKDDVLVKLTHSNEQALLELAIASNRFTINRTNTNYDVERQVRREEDRTFLFLFWLCLILFFSCLHIYSNETSQQDLLGKLELYEKNRHFVCNSCGKNFSELIPHGHNQDGTLNTAFCNQCFDNGNFLSTSLTVSDVYNDFKNKNPKSYISIDSFKKMLRWNNNPYNEEHLKAFNYSSLKWLYIIAFIIYLIVAIISFTEI